VRTEQTSARKAVREEVASSKHPLVGIWEQEPNANGTTSVLYTVLVKERNFQVSAKDREDGTILKISRVRWDGKALHFTSLFPPANHKAIHVLRVLPKGRISHDVTCTYADGENFSDREFWRKIRVKRKFASSKK